MKPKSFEFISYKIDPQDKRIIFKYKTEFFDRKSINFAEEIILPRKFKLDKIPKELLDALHLILGISYFKLYYPKKIKISKALSKEQADFWNAIYSKGLGEFCYKNNLNFNKTLFSSGKVESDSCSQKSFKNRCLVALGGGKDSLVALELLKKSGFGFTPFFVETQKESFLINNLIKQTGIKPLKIRRVLDKKLFGGLKDSYQGHIPVSAVYAFLGLLMAIIYDYSYIVVGNEYSSNFGNLEYRGEVINHQWSKSSEFEKLFQNYVKKNIAKNIIYFSLLRPFYEIRIVEMFCQYKKYFPYFSSCNGNFKIQKDKRACLERSERWCCQCPKCAFVFSLFSAFLSKKELINIFGKNLYNDEKLLSVFRDLLGFGKTKPFDCVGAFDEVKAAFYLARNKFKNDLAIKTFLPRVLALRPNGAKLAVFKTNPAPQMPFNFQFSGLKDILLLGYGKEGQTSEKYLKKYYPDLNLNIGDKKFDKNYLKKQMNFDFAVKTPGLSKNLINIPYTTATDIFFSQIKNKIIGITGSKGKSTTASLIYHILKTAGKKVGLLGNIGRPMLEVLLEPIDKDTIFVLELSSYQLDDIQHSPHIAVLTSLFPDHMDYHKSIQKYYQAKKNIINFQNENDYFIYNSGNKKAGKWLENLRSAAVDCVNQPIENLKLSLMGGHNIDNLKLAIAAAKIFNISDNVIKKAAESFNSLPHRMEFAGEFNKILFYNDAASTTPQSTIAAIRALQNIKTIFLGGTDRGYNFTQLEKEIKKNNIENIVLFPDSGKRILKSKKDFNVLETSSMKQAVEFACKHTPQGAVCLLSTASPSYSLWKNFEEKGEEFKECIKSIHS